MSRAKGNPVTAFEQAVTKASAKANAKALGSALGDLVTARLHSKAVAKINAIVQRTVNLKELSVAG